MDYLTTVEAAKKWNISSRMAAYYCEAGRVKGAVKKGKSWLVPSSAAKPVDKLRPAPAPQKYCAKENRNNYNAANKMANARKEI